jgi:hypothetical protein
MGDDTQGGASASRPKDRIVQTRVPRDLESTLKREARRRRLTVSHLIRNVLEDAFDLVDGVVANVDELVSDSVELVRRVGSDARRVAGGVRDVGRPPDQEMEDAEADSSSVWAWNRVVVNGRAECSQCRRGIGRGTEAYAGLRNDSIRPREWLCADCIAKLGMPDAEEGDAQ